MLINILHEMFKLLFWGENNGSGGTDWYAPGAEHEAFEGMCNNQFRTAYACGVGCAQLKDAGLAEYLAVAATVAELGLDHRVPRNILPWGDQPLSFFRCLLLVVRCSGVLRYRLRFFPGTYRSNGGRLLPLHRT